jgi:tetratricopeptide (TPR) repeat protein
MPRLSAKDVPHTSQTDHRVLRQNSAVPQPPEPSSVDPESARLFEAGTAGLSRQAEQRARGLLVLELAELQRRPELAIQAEKLLVPLAREAPDDIPVVHALATALALQGRTADAGARWQQILAVAPEHEGALEALAAQAIASGRQVDGLKFVDRFLAVNPWNVRMHRQRSRLLAALGRDRQALEAAQRAVEINPSHAETYLWLAQLAVRLGMTDDARRYEAVARRLQDQPVR